MLGGALRALPSAWWPIPHVAGALNRLTSSNSLDTKVNTFVFNKLPVTVTVTVTVTVARQYHYERPRSIPAVTITKGPAVSRPGVTITKGPVVSRPLLRRPPTCAINLKMVARFLAVAFLLFTYYPNLLMFATFWSHGSWTRKSCMFCK